MTDRLAPLVGRSALVTLGLFTCFILDIGGAAHDVYYISADTLQPVYIIKDLFKDPRLLAGWTWPDAPYFFPDFLFALLTAPLNVFPRFHVAAAGFLQGFAIVGTLALLLRRMAGPRGEGIAYLAFALLALGLAIEAIQDRHLVLANMAGPLFKIWYHGGAYLLTLILFAVEMPRCQNTLATLGRWHRRAYIGLVFVAVAADKLLMLFALAPLLAVKLWQWAAGEIPRRHLLERIGIYAGPVLLIVLIDTAIGKRTNLHVNEWNSLADIIRNIADAAAYILPGLDDSFLWPHGFRFALTVLPVMAAAGLTVFHIFRRGTLQPPPWIGHPQGWFLWRAAILAAPVNLAVVFFFGLYDNITGMRYLVASNMAWLPIAVIWLADPGRVWRLFVDPQPKTGTSAAMGIGLATLVTIAAMSSQASLRAHTLQPHTAPGHVARCLPRLDIAASRGRRLILADYWLVREARADLGRSILPLQILPDGAPYFWNTNLRRFHSAYIEQQGGFRQAALVFTKNLEPAALRERFGAADARTTCEGWPIAIYTNARALHARLMAAR
mgnify:CR=1 FL=1